MRVLPFAWMYGDPAEVLERRQEEIDPLLKAGIERELRNRRRRIRALVKAAKAKQAKGRR